MKVLVVEDSLLIQKQFKELFSEIDGSINLRQAFSYSEALELFPRFKPETVLMDVALPDGNSLILLQIIKSIRPSIKVILMVNFPPVSFINKCLEMGVDDFFEKSNLYSLLYATSKNRITIN